MIKRQGDVIYLYGRPVSLSIVRLAFKVVKPIVFVNETQIGEEFRDLLKSQQKVDVYYYTFGTRKTDPTNVEGVTSYAANKEDFEKNRGNWLMGDWIVPQDIEKSFEAGKGVIFIGISYDYLSGLQDNILLLNPEGVKFNAKEGAFTVIHEEQAHAKDVFTIGRILPNEVGHENFQNKRSQSSPPTKALETERKYANTTARKALNQLDKAVDKAYNKYLEMKYKK